ncbi:MAG: ABC transporter ATP-binding protein [Solirubrobacteraceae bacterium]
MSTRPTPPEAVDATGLSAAPKQADAEVIPAAAARGPLVLEARALAKDFRLSQGLHRETLSAVRGVSLGLYQSAVVALVGESGSGKSTVARMLAGQERPTAGQILLDGNEVQPAQHSQFRAYKGSVQMVFQDPFASLNAVHTVRYALKRPVRLHQRAKGKEAIAAELTRLCERVRLTPPEQFLAKYPHELSGGQRQRVAIARALAARPRVLLADEPVSMLDVSIRLEVLDLLDELRSQFQLAVLYVTHDIASARYFADDTLVMYAGELVERGPSEDVTQQPAHPYTQLLVASAPDPDNLAGELKPVSGEVRRAGSALSSTIGCRFAPRCPLAEDRCRAQSPPLLPVNPQRAAACWRLDVAAPDLLNQTQTEREAIKI